MNLGTIRDEAQDRGFQYITDTRMNLWVNQAYKEICSWTAWPFLETSVTGASPLTITDLGPVLSVVGSESNLPLDWVDRRVVLIGDDDLGEVGTPALWWAENTTIYVWPGSSTDTVTVRYMKVPVDLSADADIPLVPTEFHDLIVDGAVLRGMKDNDMWQEYQVARQIWQQEIDLMVDRVMGRNLAGPGTIVATYGHQDW